MQQDNALTARNTTDSNKAISCPLSVLAGSLAWWLKPSCCLFLVDMDLLALPDEVLIAIAAQLPPGLRLSSFCLAHSRLKAAVDHATKAQDAFSHTFSMFTACSQHQKTDEDLWDCYDDPRDVPDHRQNCCRNFAGAWLPQHGQHLTKLQLNNFNYGFSTLPPGLKELAARLCWKVA